MVDRAPLRSAPCHASALLRWSSAGRLVLPLFVVQALACGDSAQPAAADTSATDTSATDTSATDTTDATDAALDFDAPPEGPDLTGADSLEADLSTDDADAGDDVVGGPRSFTEPGPHRVGFRVSELTYEPADASAPRTLRVVAWYPTRDTTGAPVSYQGFIPQPDLLGNAAPAADLGPRPVLVFSHGNGSLAEQSHFLTSFFASHGYLVVAPDHTGNTFGATTPALGIFHWRPDDIRGLLDHLEGLADAPASDPFAALAPLVSDRVAVAGHSFGGYTALAAAGGLWDVDLLLSYCEANALPLGGCAAITSFEDIYRGGFLDPRVDAIIPMTPGAVVLFGSAGLTHIEVPTLLMTGALDRTTPDSSDGDPAWDQLSGRAHNLRLDFETAGHFTFSDACGLAALGIPIGQADGCGAGFIDAARAHTAINAYALAFTELHLMGDEAGLDLLEGRLVIESDLRLGRGTDP